MKRQVYALAALGVSLFPVATSAQSLEACMTEQCVDHFQQFKRASNRGNVAATTTLGQFYFHGYGTEQDLSHALRQFKKSARNGDPIAQYHAGIILINEGTPESINAGVLYLKKAAIKRHHNATLLLGLLYLDQKRDMLDTSVADYYLAQAYASGHDEFAMALDMIEASPHIKMSQLPKLNRAINNPEPMPMRAPVQDSKHQSDMDDLFDKMLLSMRKRRIESTVALNKAFCGNSEMCFEDTLIRTLERTNLTSLN